MKLSSLRPSYAINRWREIAFTKEFPDAPWITAAAVRLLDGWLKPTDVGIEWGSGRSTIWIARRVAKVLSIEDDKGWYDVVVGKLKDAGVSEKVEYRYFPKAGGELTELKSHPFAEAAEIFADGSVDFALVDGTMRSTCMWMGMRKLKPGGLLILDNANRFLPNISMGKPSTIHEPRTECVSPEWRRIWEALVSWRMILTTDNLWNTFFWVKPVA